MHYIVLLVFGLCFSNVLGGDPNDKIWAVLVSGLERGYEIDYATETDVFQAHQILTDHGVPPWQIILMCPDTVAHSPQNPFPGKLFSRNGGPNVYNPLLIDYRGKYKAELFESIITGDALNAQKFNGSGRVLQSGPNDHVFIYFADHGGPGGIGFPGDLLTAYQLQRSVQRSYANSKYGKLLMYIMACQSGLMFSHDWIREYNGLALTSSGVYDNSHACEKNETVNAFLSDLFSANWFHFSQQADLSDHTILTEYLRVGGFCVNCTGAFATGTKLQYPHIFGDLMIADMPLAAFHGHSKSHRPQPHKWCQKKEQSVCADKLSLLKNKLPLASSNFERKQIMDEIRRISEGNHIVNNLYQAIAESVNPGHSEELMQDSKNNHHIHDMYCHHRLIKNFERNCDHLIKEIPHSRHYYHVWNNMCKDDHSDIEAVITKVNMVCWSYSIIPPGPQRPQ